MSAIKEEERRVITPESRAKLLEAIKGMERSVTGLKHVAEQDLSPLQIEEEIAIRLNSYKVFLLNSANTTSIILQLIQEGILPC